MEWGTANEAFAKAAYELATGLEVEPIGFALHETIKRLGASPDGGVGSDGLVECKCPTTATHIEYIIAGVVPAEYHWQMLCQMACADRQWCDFVSYDPRLPKRLQLFVRRFEREEARISEMLDEVTRFLAEVDEALGALEKSTMIDLDPTLETKLRESLRAVSGGSV